MKKTIALIITILILLVMKSSAQSKSDTTLPKQLSFTDSTVFCLSARDVQGIVNSLDSQVTVQQSKDFWLIFNYIIRLEAQAYDEKNKNK